MSNIDDDNTGLVYDHHRNIEEGKQPLIYNETKEPWYKDFKKPNCTTVVLGFFGLLAISLLVSFVIWTSVGKDDNRFNVIFMISDGWSPSGVTLARIMAKRNLTHDSYLVGSVKTYSQNSWITDSAAAATAYSTGKKTNNYYTGVSSEKKPLGTILEAAIEKKMATGIVVTSRVTHATPASFTAHVQHRYYEDLIAKQQLNFTSTKVPTFDLVWGGGRSKFAPDLRPDHLDLYSEIKSRGSDFDGKITLPTWGLFADQHLDYEIDRNPLEQPSLKEMTSKALDLLSNSSKHGFLLLIEGSKIDLANHNQDPAAASRDSIMYDETFELVRDFAERNPNTIVISVSDHSTGDQFQWKSSLLINEGLTLGTNDHNYSATNSNEGPYIWFPERLALVNHSVEWMYKEIFEKNRDIRTVLEEAASLWNSTSEYPLTDDEINLIQLVYNNKHDPPYDVWRLLGSMISWRCNIGYTTVGHDGSDILFYTINAPEIKANIDNTEFFSFIEKKLELSSYIEKANVRVSSWDIGPNYTNTKGQSLLHYHD